MLLAGDVNEAGSEASLHHDLVHVVLVLVPRILPVLRCVLRVFQLLGGQRQDYQDVSEYLKGSHKEGEHELLFEDDQAEEDTGFVIKAQRVRKLAEQFSKERDQREEGWGRGQLRVIK